MRGAALAVAVAAALAGAAPAAGADPDDAAAAAADAAAGEAFRAASRRAIAGEPGAADALEALGAARPITRWTDDAWAEAARLAERAGDFARARRAHAQVIAVGTDAALVARSRAALARLEAATGAGAWDAVAAEHDRLVAEAFGGGEPRDALRALEALAARHPAYPRATLARLAIAQGWELEGRGARAGVRAGGAGVGRARRPHARGLALARTAIRLGELDEAGATLDALAREPGADVRAIARVRGARRRRGSRVDRRAAWLVLAALALAAAAAARRLAGAGGRPPARSCARPSRCCSCCPWSRCSRSPRAAATRWSRARSP